MAEVRPPRAMPLMKWWRLPVALALFWAIWFAWPPAPWQLPPGAMRAESATALAGMAPGTTVILDGRLWPLHDDVARPLHDGAFIYQRWLRYKSDQGGWTTLLFEARQPAFRLQLADGSTVRFVAGHYREDESGFRHDGLQAVLPTTSTARLRLAPALAPWRDSEARRPLAAERHAAGFRPGDAVVVYAEQGATAADAVLRAAEIAPGPFAAHAEALAGEHRRWFLLSLFLRAFLSLIPLAVLAGLWQRPLPATPPAVTD
ncbi:MAG: hypothetical protein ACK4UT_07505 [Moraxellaceae bacterium]